MIAQIINGSIDPSWVIVVLCSVVGFFMIHTLMKMNSRMDKMEKRDDIITRVLLQMLTKLGGDEGEFFDDLRSQLNEK